VAGASGYTGQAVVSALRTKGVDVVAHVRPDSSSLSNYRSRFEALGARVDSTPWQTEPMRATLASIRPELVFSLLGTTRSRGRRVRREEGRVENYATIDVGLTMMTYEAARRCGTMPRFIYLSSVGVTPETGNAYLAARALVEGCLKDGGLPYIIARPSLIAGSDREESRPLERIGAPVFDFLLRVAALFGARRLRERYRSTTSTVLAGALVRLALDPQAASRVYESEELR
jgi:nucleoside-diphosphate-sugar epimerase